VVSIGLVCRVIFLVCSCSVVWILKVEVNIVMNFSFVVRKVLVSDLRLFIWMMSSRVCGLLSSDLMLDVMLFSIVFRMVKAVI